ncbi:hypothetical protein C7B65_26330 [Phormidesmis priestleyi ULC007]|uniref:Uncharacterized protein n=1 Tax=Phormidesmis priestleyi ULC007 TaxID=1920490 RepID=A0A2T1D210_9CYAN|nr:hypothetical protein [Phormidesmis priestleyi]PSB14533.1 hypothetical protein C7B65_26330 [Phormidesmis priestleyi ULC007]
MIDRNLVLKYFPNLEWRGFDDLPVTVAVSGWSMSVCASFLPEASCHFDPSITVSAYADGTFSAELYLTDSTGIQSWIDDETLEGVLRSLKEHMEAIREIMSYALAER